MIYISDDTSEHQIRPRDSYSVIVKGFKISFFHQARSKVLFLIFVTGTNEHLNQLLFVCKYRN